MKASDLVNYLADVVPYRRSSSLDWIVPVSVGLSLGVAIGVGVGVLVAPTSGENARRRLREGAGRLRERAEKAKDRALGAAQRAQDQIEDQIQQSTSAPAEERSFISDLGAR